eukprot:4360764-Prymnesium_polylepis.1
MRVVSPRGARTGPRTRRCQSEGTGGASSRAPRASARRRQRSGTRHARGSHACSGRRLRSVGSVWPRGMGGGATDSRPGAARRARTGVVLDKA